MKKVASSVGFLEYLIVEAKGKASELCLLWSNALKVKVLEFNRNIIAIEIDDGVQEWSFIGFSGPPYQAQRRRAWVNLHALLESINGPWVCCGEFNVIISEGDKAGRRIGSSSTPSYLKKSLFDVGAIDLGFAGNQFTCSNK